MATWYTWNGDIILVSSGAAEVVTHTFPITFTATYGISAICTQATGTFVITCSNCEISSVVIKAKNIASVTNRIYQIRVLAIGY